MPETSIPDGIFNLLYARLSILGASGVSLFFIISGFLITGILMDTAHEDKCLKKFYIRRSLRIFPLYYVGLLIVILLYSFFIGKFEVDFRLVLHLVYAQNWISIFDSHYLPFEDTQYKIVSHFWSLAIEEQFYLFWPVTFLFFYRRFSPFVCIGMMVTLILASISLRFYLCSGAYHWQIPYVLTFARLDGLVLGALLVFVMKKSQKFLKFVLGYVDLPLLLLPITIFVILLGFDQIYMMNVKYLVLLTSLYFFFLMAYVLSGKARSCCMRVLRSRFLGQIAEISYGLYIFHLPIMYLIAVYLRQTYKFGFWDSHLILLFCGFSIAFVISWLSYRFFEKPILNLKHRFASYES